jgi:Mn2+/Fe2+ NRAMP family transporter
MGLGVVITFSGVSPIRILFVAGIVGGLATPIGLVYLLLVASDDSLMSRWRVSGPLLIAGWVVTGLVTLTSLIYLMQQITG